MSKTGIGVCFPRGFKASGVAAGIKPGEKLDLALLVSETAAVATAVFTSNIVKAAAIQVSQKHLACSPAARAVIMTSGNANAATGEDGIVAVHHLCKTAAEALQCAESDILIAQTGLIGKPFPTERGVWGVRRAIADLRYEGGEVAAKAIMTTDTKYKVSARTISIGGGEVRLGAMAKGAAMLSPALATMLATISTDAAISKELLVQALGDAVDESFHMMVVDGCRSTNDTVFVLANGCASAPPIVSAESSEYRLFRDALTEVCTDLARQMAADAEGASKFFEVRITGAATRDDARKAARAVASSVLVKCSLAGEVAYWGRVISELGASGAQFDPAQVEISYGPHCLCRDGVALACDEAAVDRYMKQRDLVITARLGSGSHSAHAFGCDLTHAYVTENMGKS